MRYYIIAGEASGDLHAANLARALRHADPDAQMRGWGGAQMRAQGVDVTVDYSQVAVMGYADVARSLRRITRLMRECQADILRWRPDALVLVDYPGMNLKMARFGRRHGIKVFYYIAPKVWAWKSWRLKALRRDVDHLFSILPFEVGYYRQRGMEIDYIGNPLMDSLAATLDRGEPAADFLRRHNLPAKPIVALLPGSRRGEIAALLPPMAQVAREFPGHQFVVSGAPGADASQYAAATGPDGEPLPVVFGDTYQLLLHAQAALVASGTATLEAALIGAPQAVCYKMRGGRLAYALGRMVLKIKFVSLVNLIIGRELVPELLQHRCTPRHMARELRRILPGGEGREAMQAGYRELARIVGQGGASERAGRNIAALLHADPPKSSTFTTSRGA